MTGQNIESNKLDRIIAKLIMQDSTLTNNQIGEKVGLSSSATNERIRKMKKDGSIKRFATIIDSKFMNMELGAFISIWMEGDNDAEFPKYIMNNENILECHRVTGEASYLLKVRCENTKALDNLTTNFLKKQPGVTKTITQIILSSDKEESFIVS